MLKSSEFNSAVPKFTNGNYANNPVDPTNIEEPTMQDYVRGVEPLETLPAQWWNWLCNQFTSRFNKLNTYVKNIFDELTQLLSLVNVTPDGTEGSITTGQLKNAFKELYPTYVSNKLELGTTYVKQTTTVNGHALSGNVTVSKSDVGLGSVANTADSANVASSGTAKFTTGGAYNLLTSIAPYFSSSTAYSVGQFVTYQNKLYECTTAHSAGSWNPSHFTARTISGKFVPQARTVNGHALTSDISVTKSDVGLGSVVNTGDSDTPVPGGTTKFTTGGAYTEFNKYIKPNLKSWTGLGTITGGYVLIGSIPISNGVVSYASLDIKVFSDSALGGGLYPVGTIHIDMSSGNTSSRFNIYGWTDIVITSSSINSPSIFVYRDDGKYKLYIRTEYPYRRIEYSQSRISMNFSNGNFEEVSTPAGDIEFDSISDTSKIIYIKEDSAPTVNSNALVTSGGVYTELAKKSNTTYVDTELAKKVDKTTTVNGHALSGNVTVTKNDVGLGNVANKDLSNVVNTGDSNSPSLNGTDKFTTGGAYNLLTSLAPIFSTTTSYAVGDMVTYSGRLYICTTAHSAGTWNASHFTVNDLNSFYNFTGGAKEYNKWLQTVFGWSMGVNWVDSNIQKDGTHSLIEYGNGLWLTIVNQKYLYKSTDGKIWTDTGYVFINGVDDLIYSNNMWMATCNAAVGQGVWWSTDGETWTRGTGNYGNSTVRHPYYGNSMWLISVYGTGSSDAKGIWWSTDGKAWSQGTGANQTYSTNTFVYGNGIWVAGMASHGFWWSTDGKSWTQNTGSSTSSTVLCLYYHDGLFIGGTNANGIWYSVDGKNWTQCTGIGSSYRITCLLYSNGLWIAGTYEHGLWWSNDGIRWSQSAGNSTSYTIMGISYSNGIWIAGTSQHGVYRSTNGKSWVQVNEYMSSYEISVNMKCDGYTWVIGSYGNGILWSSCKELLNSLDN